MNCSRRQLILLAIIVSMPSVACAAGSIPDVKDDSAIRIRRDLEALGKEYLALKKPSRTQMTSMGYKVKHLELRCDRLGGADNAEIRNLLSVIKKFKVVVDKRTKQEYKRRAEEKKPYVFGAISGPQMSDGGHSAKGLKYLQNEVDEFVKHYRGLKKTRFSRNEVYLDGSRDYFKRTIESSIKTAIRRIKDPKPENTVYVGGGVIYDNYSPQQNLQWALDVARIAQSFEGKVGGSTGHWREWQQKIRWTASKLKVKLK